MTTADNTDHPETIELSIQGMHCGSCVALIEEVLGETPGVHEASVDLDGARAAVRFDPAVVSIGDLCAAVAGAGYAASAPERSPGQ